MPLPPAFLFASTPESEWASSDVAVTVPRALRPALFRAARQGEAEAIDAAAKLLDTADDHAAADPDDWFVAAGETPDAMRARAAALYERYAEARDLADRLIGHSWVGNGPPRNDELLRRAFDEAVATHRRDRRAERREPAASPLPPAALYRAIHAEIGYHLRQIEHIGDAAPVPAHDEDGDDRIANAADPRVLASLARQAARDGYAREAVKRVIEITEPDCPDPDQRAADALRYVVEQAAIAWADGR